MEYAGANWLEGILKKQLSPFHRTVADILGAVFRGIYHISDAVLQADWDKPYLELLGRGGFAGCLGTWDGCELTDLVVLCHDACIRLEISPALIPYDPDADGGDYAEEINGLKEAISDAGYEPDDIAGMPALHLLFHPREREGGISRRHPTMEDALGRVRRVLDLTKE